MLARAPAAAAQTDPEDSDEDELSDGERESFVASMRAAAAARERAGGAVAMGGERLRADAETLRPDADTGRAGADKTELMKRSLAQLKKECKSLGLSTKSTKERLAARLAQHAQSKDAIRSLSGVIVLVVVVVEIVVVVRVVAAVVVLVRARQAPCPRQVQ